MTNLSWVFLALWVVTLVGLGWMLLRSLGRERAGVGVVASAEARAVSAEGAVEGVRASAEREVSECRASEAAAREKVLSLSGELATLRERVENAELMRQELERNESRMREAFRSLSSEVLKGNSDAFLKLAREQFAGQQQEAAGAIEERRSAVERMVKPIGETLDATRKKLEEMESVRLEQFAALGQRMDLVTQAGQGLREETNRLTKALSRPEVRGQYGEIQLRRVAELAGMSSYCDFTEQTSERDDEGRLLRPDMVVRLPNERVIAVDAKTNTYAYLEAVNAGTDEEREAHLVRFAKHVSDQAKKLAGKRYWSSYEGSPEFVVMFVPGDHFVDAALQRQPDLLDVAAQQNVILASPSTLIGLLRAVAVGWREQSLTEQAGELLALGSELHDRARAVFEHAAKLGRSLDQSAKAYNSMVGSIENRLSPTLRKFEEAGAKGKQGLPELGHVEVSVRELSSGLGAENERA